MSIIAEIKAAIPRGAIAATFTSMLGVIFSILAASVPMYENFFGSHSLIIASSPPDARIRINGLDEGKTPLTVQLKKGAYTIEASLPGYKTAQHAVYVSREKANIANIDLQHIQTNAVSGTSAPPATNGTTNESSAILLAEIEKLKAAVIANPDEALSMPLIREKMRTQEELTKALREDIKEVKEQSKWYLGSMIAIIVGLLGVIATLFVGQRAKSGA